MISAAQSFSPFFLAAGATRLRVARFAADGPGACLLLNGQTEFIEKYFEVIDELRARGFSVVTFDWRGQGGSNRLLPDRRKAHIDDFAEYDQDLDTVIREVVKPMMAEGEKPIALAHSMGGNILLRRLHDVQGEFAAAILSAPMVGIKPRGVPWWLVEKIADRLNRNGPSRDFIWGMAQRDQLKLPFAADRHFGRQTLCPQPGAAGRRSGIAPQRSHLGLAGGGAARHRTSGKNRLCRSDKDTSARDRRGARPRMRY